MEILGQGGERISGVWTGGVKTKVHTANRAITALTRHGGGPVHINLQTLYSWDFSVAKLPEVKMVRRMLVYVCTKRY